MRSADFLPTAPWRRESLVIQDNQPPHSPANASHGTDSLPRQVSRKPSNEDRLKFPSTLKPKSRDSLRKPQRVPSLDTRTSGENSGNNSSSRRKSLFRFRRSTRSTKSSGAPTDMAIHSGAKERHRRNAVVNVANDDSGGQRRPSEGSSGGVGSTEATDLDPELMMLDREAAQNMDLETAHDDEDDALSLGSKDHRGAKDFRRSLNLQQIFLHGSTSRLLGGSFSKSRSFSKRSSASNNSSLLSSLSSAFSSLKEGHHFVFTAGSSARSLVEREGHNFPDIIVDESLDERLHSGSHHKDPPRYPSRHDSSSCSYNGSFCSGSCSLSPDGSSSCECYGDGIVASKRSGRRTSLGTPIAAIREVEQEVDGSSFMMTNDENDEGIDGSAGDVSISVRRIPAESDSNDLSKSGPLHRSAPVDKVGVSKEINQFLAEEAQKKHRKSDTAAFTKHIKRPSGASIFSLTEELPFPLRRESISSQSQVSSQSRQWKRNARVPETIPPEATIMEKREFLKRKLTFSKQQLVTVLEDVSKLKGC